MASYLVLPLRLALTYPTSPVLFCPLGYTVDPLPAAEWSLVLCWFRCGCRPAWSYPPELSQDVTWEMISSQEHADEESFSSECKEEVTRDEVRSNRDYRLNYRLSNACEG